MVEEKKQQLAAGQLDLLCEMDVEEAVVSSSEAVEPLLEAASSPQPLAVALPSFTSQASIPLPETLLILDTETSGLDPKQDHCLEVGAILFHAPRRAVLAQHSFLLPVQDNAAESINHIPADVTRLNQPWREGLEYFQALLDAAELLVAHNAAFDRQWFGKDHLPAVSKPWLCTMEDIAWPVDRQLRSRPSVRDLALAYGVPVWAAHRALTDCIYLAEVFCRCNDLETLLLHGLEPRRLMRAQVSYQQRHLAKQAGFRWNDPVQGAWTRRLSDRQAAELDFQVVSIDQDEQRAVCA
ncbi:MAG: 3'-5' exonuclease [Prochlorococcus sp.]|nr:3'-5' exonuclease [Prochlorococcaceae cyanobacterium ETNP18_MAG_17]MDP6321076.1 3'-5' exonuclease [Prochlorococcaceae cyanobacterium ETNP14_MAG_5]MDP7328181.1 3'-5' exonuclease [Prochlorococcaceae cyanobacterium ETNP7_MAG_30]